MSGVHVLLVTSLAIDQEHLPPLFLGAQLHLIHIHVLILFNIVIHFIHLIAQITLYNAVQD